VDLGRHALIEASAGTGKTYRLEQLVVDLLTEYDARLEQILLVTYTEKATGELRGRVRNALEQALAASSGSREQALQQALDSFDDANVYTIHGFCQRVLQDYAFENRHAFQCQLVNDKDLLLPCLREIQRGRWRQEYGDELCQVLELAAYGEIKGAGENWENLVQQVALSLRPACDHRLMPAMLPNWPSIVRELNDGLQADLARLRRLAGPIDHNQLTDHAWYIGYGQLRLNPRWRESWQNKVLKPVLNWLADPHSAMRPLAAFRRLLHACNESARFQKRGFSFLIDKLGEEARAELPHLCPNLHEAVRELDARRESVDWAVLEKQLTIRTVGQVQELLAAHKHDHGLISFEDMLTRVDEALNPAKNPGANALLALLRHRYRYAVVDEFQDTDPIQWRIFKRIFVEGNASNRLVCVGDPKQAIFAFRGADLHAYLKAQDELKTQFAAEQHHLDINWRSCSELLVPLNHLFADGDWFSENGVRYREVQAADNHERPHRVLTDRTGRSALNLVDLNDIAQLSQARRENARFVADEIRRLLFPASGQPALEFDSNGQERPLLAGDICVLVFKRLEAVPLLEALRVAGIRYTFYKQPGLWQSDEAVHLGYVLRAIARPEEPERFKKALLTRFFRISPAELALCEELPSQHLVNELFQRWCTLAEKRDWAKLFQSVLEDTGVLLVRRHEHDADREMGNLLHILRTLQLAAYARDLDLLGILDVFEEMRRRPGDEDSNLQPIETQRPKVQVMTVHASKGLEFPILFLAGGFTSGRSPSYLTYRDDNNNLIFDIGSGNTAAKDAFERERDAEERRLLYVALTRAMFKLYVPRVASETKYQKPGPVVTVLTNAIEKSNLEKLKPPFVEVIARFSNAGVAATAQGPLPDGHTMRSRRVGATIRLDADALFPKVDPYLGQRRALIRSFSSIHRKLSSTAPEPPSFAETLPRADEDRPDSFEEAAPIHGRVFGDMIHDTLEKIEFASVGSAVEPAELLLDNAPARVLIDEVISTHFPKLFSRQDPAVLRQACRQQIARLVWNGLRTPLSAAGGPLWQVAPRDRLQELEFHFPILVGPPLPEVRRIEGFLTGFIDLVFRRNGKYFLVDWKTNLLAGSYTPQALAQSMIECDYVRQYRLYLQALARWLKKSCGAAFDFTRDFGGVYYLYLRGMNGADESSGVFFCQPTVDDLQLDRVLTN
jgi:exodeoxyribonuclease V beta subunit